MVNGVVNQQTLLFDLLRATYQNQEVYPLLQQNLDKLNHNFALLLQQWVSEQFAKEPAKAINIARIIVKFSNLIQQFEQGNVEKNIEIAIAGYEIVLQVVTYEAFPKKWDIIQQALGSAYQQEPQGRSNPRVVKKPRSKFPSKKPFHRGTGTQREHLNFSVLNTA